MASSSGSNKGPSTHLPLPSPTQNEAPKPKRIINKIPVDFNKLREAGLDRKIAEALSKQKFLKTAASASNTSLSATALPMASSISNMQLQQQQHRVNQRLAPRATKRSALVAPYIQKVVPPKITITRPVDSPPFSPVDNRTPTPEDAATAAERSLQVKALIRSRILKKTQQTTSSIASSSITTVSISPSSLTQSIPKPDIAPRQSSQKGPTPLVLNSQAASSTTSTLSLSAPRLTQSISKPAKAPRQSSQKVLPPLVLNSQSASSAKTSVSLSSPSLAQSMPKPDKAPRQSSQKGTSPVVLNSQLGKSKSTSDSTSPVIRIQLPLIVLENKVLAPNEKIDLRGLGLPSASSNKNSTESSRDSKTPPSTASDITSTTASRPVSSSNESPASSGVVNSDASSSLSTTPITTNPPDTTPTSAATIPPLSSNKTTQAGATPDLSHTVKKMSPKKIILNADKFKVSREKLAELAKQIRSQIKQQVPTKNPLSKTKDQEIRNFSAVQSNDEILNNNNLSPSSGSDTKDSAPHKKQEFLTPEKEAAVLEPDVPTSPQMLSAVDFISQLAAGNTGSEDMPLEPSPEELSLDASFRSLQPVVETAGKSEELTIGKILNLQDMDILEATMDTADNANVLRISPNAALLREKLENSEATTQALDNIASNKAECSEQQLSQSIKESTTDSAELSLNEMEASTKPDMETKTLPVPLAKRKKAKINLVQRTKKPNVIKPVETKTVDNYLEAKDNKGNNLKDSNSMIVDEQSEELVASQVTTLTSVSPTNDKANGANNVDLHSETSKENLSEMDTFIETSSLWKKHPKCTYSRHKKQFDELSQKEVSTNQERTTTDNKEGELQEQSTDAKAANDDTCEQIAKDLSLSANQDTPKEIFNSEEPSTLPVELESLSCNTNSKPPYKGDVTQLYHPPKMVKHKPKIINDNSNNNNEPVTTGDKQPPSLSLLEVVTQELPPAQGIAQVPFRKSLADTEASCTDATLGIKNLITHIAPDKLSSPGTSGTLEQTEIQTKEIVKPIRKRIVKARPVLGKRSHKSEVSAKIPLTKQSLMPNSTENESETVEQNVLKQKKEERIPPIPVETVSRMFSTSDDESIEFRGFEDNKEPIPKQAIAIDLSSKRINRSQVIETDISDDATPDDDEDAEKLLSVNKRSKTENDKDALVDVALIEKQPLVIRSPDKSNQSSLQKAESSVAEKILKENQPSSEINHSAVIENQTQLLPEASLLMTVLEPLASEMRPTETEATTANESLLTPLKRRRGRPPGRKSNAQKTPKIQESPAASTAQHAQVNIASPLPTTIPKKRGRKPKNREVATAELTPKQLQVTPNLSRSCSPKRPFKKRKIETLLPNDSDGETDETPLFVPIISSRAVGRPRSKPQEEVTPNQNTEQNEVSDFNIRLLLIRKREQLETTDELREGAIGSDAGQGPYQCGLCLVRTNRANWLKHLSEHYGVGWLADQPTPHLTRSAVIKIMINFLKNEASPKRLACRLCGRELASGLGMLLHLESCGAPPQRLECAYCKRSYTKMTLPQHQRVCGARYEEKQEPLNTDAERTQSSEPIYSNSGRAKRKSTLKAEVKLKKIEAHLKDPQTPSEQFNPENHIEPALEDEGSFQCSICKPDSKTYPNKSAALAHVQEQHANEQALDFDTDSSEYNGKSDKESSTDELESDGMDSNEEEMQTDDENYEDEHDEKVPKKKAYKMNATKTIRKTNAKTGELSTVYGREYEPEEFIAKRWKSFKLLNYSTDILYEKLLPIYNKLTPAELETLLAQLDETSMRFAYCKAEDNKWSQLKRLEGFSGKNEHFSYLGASIKQLAWVPLPKAVKSQYLLCSLRSNRLGNTRQCKVKHENALMLLLKCTAMDAEKKRSWSLQTNLHYGIRVPQGPVHCFAFMPSGGYNAAGNRLGLLAIGSAISEVKIYALPLRLDGEASVLTETNIETVIELKPLIMLSLDVERHVQDHCLSLCWSESAGHNFLAAGYGSGNVVYWGIGEEHALNCITRDNLRHFVPINCFYLGERCVKYLEMHYDSNGPRWLALGTYTRKLFVFDISNLAHPLPVYGQYNNLNYFLTFLHWPLLWETVVFGSSEVCVKQFPRFIGLNPCGVHFSTRTIDHTLAAARTAHFDNWQNVLVLGIDQGDVIFVNPRDLNVNSPLQKLSTNYRALAKLDLHNFSSANDPNKLTSAEDFRRDYGLLFKPLVSAPPDKKNLTYLVKNRRPSFNLIKMLRNNSVRYNNNNSEHRWVAVGAEHGILRIINFQREKFF